MKTIMRKRVLVTGGSGYLGSHLCKQLLKNKFEVHVFDRDDPYHDYYTKYYSGDIRQLSDITKVFESNGGFDFVIHLASRIEVGESQKHPTEFWSINVSGTINIIHTMKKFGCDKIIFSSTAAVYSPSNFPIKESQKIGNNSVYGNTKHACEMAIEDSGLNFIIFRYFNLSGADPDGDLGELHEPETHLIPIIFKNKDNFTILGNDFNTKDGTTVRDYVHVNDVAEAHILAIQYLQDSNPSKFFNMGSGEGYSILEILNRVKELLNVDIKYKFGEKRNGDPDCLVADITSVKEVLGFNPKHNIDSILKTSYDWHKNTIQ
jgi:UDP-glucose 4-epimerase